MLGVPTKGNRQKSVVLLAYNSGTFARSQNG